MIYLDHNATSPLRPEAKDAMFAALADAGNASSIHAAGRRARARVETARQQVAKLAGAKAASVVFTSGGSEANALALRGAVAGALAANDRITCIFISAIEHESVRANAVALSETAPALALTEIPVTRDGAVDPDALRRLLVQGKGRALISIMAANNETGVVQNVDEITKTIRSECEDAILHVDAVQAVGRIPLSFDALGADLLTFSSHKLGGPQGAGALLVRNGTALSPLALGAQESGRRGGTENVAAIAGFGAAAAAVRDIAKLQRLRDRFEAGVKQLAPGAVIFGEGSTRLANTSGFAIPGLSAETALIALDLDGVALSSGSACSSGKTRSSHVLDALGVGENLARGALRLSLGWSSQDEDIDAVLAALARLLARKARLTSVSAA